MIWTYSLCQHEHGREGLRGYRMRNRLLAATALTTTIIALVPGTSLAQVGVVDWSGPYLGVSASAAYSNTTFNFDYTNQDDSPSSVLVPELGLGGTVTGGFNLQSGNVVYGLEADGTVTTLSGRVTGTGPGANDSIDINDRLNAVLSLRGRLGVTTGQVLFYGTVGLAVGLAGYETDIRQDTDAVPATATGLAFGPTAGLGVEVALNDAISLKAEGVVTHLGGPTATGDNGKGPYSVARDAAQVDLRTGINVHF
jgi:outer membrane immunogenic protein